MISSCPGCIERQSSSVRPFASRNSCRVTAGRLPTGSWIVITPLLPPAMNGTRWPSGVEGICRAQSQAPVISKVSTEISDPSDAQAACMEVRTAPKSQPKSTRWMGSKTRPSSCRLTSSTRAWRAGCSATASRPPQVSLISCHTACAVANEWLPSPMT